MESPLIRTSFLSSRNAVGWLLATACAAASAQVPQDNLIDSRKGAEFETRTVGGSYGTDWNIWSDGYIETTVAIPNDDSAYQTQFIVNAYGSQAGGVWPEMEVYVDGKLVDKRTVNTTNAKDYTFNTSVRAGMRKVKIRFINDAIINGADRNLLVRSLKVVGPDPLKGLPATAGSFPLQSISILNGFFPSNVEQYSTTACSSDSPGCTNIDFVKAVGGNNVTFTSICTVGEGASTCEPQIAANNDEERALRVAIRYARSKGLGVTLKPFLLVSGTVPQVAGWTPPDPAKFYESWGANLKRHARIAREEGAELLMVGAEFGAPITGSSPANNSCQRWTQLLNAVRAEAAAVKTLPANSPAALKLTYSPTLAGFWNNISSNEAPYVCFWDQMDYIGVNAYHHMNLMPTNGTVSARIGSNWNAFKRMFKADMPLNTSSVFQYVLPSEAVAAGGYGAFDLTSTASGSYQQRYNTQQYSTKWYTDYVIDQINARFKTSLTAKGKYPLKAILTEVGAPSSPNVQGYWGSTHGGEGYNASTWPVYVDEQARGWDGYLRAFRGDQRIVGISMWGLRPYHARTWVSDQIEWLVDYDFNGKVNGANKRVTEETVCQWFKRGDNAKRVPCWQ